MLRFCRNAGQGCGATTRILVHRGQYDEFVEAAVAFLRDRVPVGDPRDEETEVGPLISAEHRERVEGYLASRRRQRGDPSSPAAAAPTCPASTWNRRWSPTSTRPTRSARTSCSPRSRPSWSTTPSTRRWRSPTTAGTASTPSSGAIPRRRGTSALRLETGTVAINGGGGARPDVPWTGFKRSGVGSEMGLDGYAEFFTVRHLQWPEG